MSENSGYSGPQFRPNLIGEQAGPRTTIVGGRPPNSGKAVGNVPRGIEVLVRKAAVDPAFQEMLLHDWKSAAAAIGLVLDPAEAMMLAATPRAHLNTVIAQTQVPQEHRRAFLGHAAAAMLAVLGAMTTGCETEAPACKGITPDPPPTRGISSERPRPRST